MLFAKFSNELPGQTQAPAWAEGIFDPERPGSFSHFYDAMSFGKLRMRGEVAPRRYASAQEAATYLSSSSTEPGGYGRFSEEILRQADADVDFSRFDNNGPDGVPNSGDDDGFVDAVFIVTASTPPNFIVGRATGVSHLGFDDDFITDDVGAAGALIRIASRQGAFQEGRSFAEAVGVMCHEYGHVLGLPDLFNTEFFKKENAQPQDDSAGIGAWGLMGWGALGWNGDDGPNAFCAWSLEQLGWIGRADERLVEVPGDAAGLVLEDVHAGGTVFKIPLRVEGAVGSSLLQEYLLLEQRTRAGSYYNRSLPAPGLLIWHIRPQALNSRYSEHKDRDDHYKPVDLVCADGLYQDAGYPLGQVADGEHGRDNLDFWAHDSGYSAAHAGNLGDATDPFDGIEYTRFDLGSNPSSNPQGLMSAISSGLHLHLQSRGAAMQVDVQQATWAGTLTEEVHWAGTVQVDGDLIVAPEGRLVIHGGTQVHFAGTDRLGSGLDPARCEIEVRGDIHIDRFTSVKKVVFAAQVPGERWRGILLDPVDPKRIRVPESAFEVRDADKGISFAGYPEGCWGLVLSPSRLIDDPAGATAGNGDGRLSPGESFQLEVELYNCSLELLDRSQVDFSWDRRLVKPAWMRARETTTGFSQRLERLHPGSSHKVNLPVLNLDPQVKAGQQVELISTWTIRNRGCDCRNPVLQDTLSLVVEGAYPAHEVSFQVPDREVRGASVRVRSEQTSSIQALVQGEVEAVDLLVRSLPELDPVAEIPMLRREDRGEQRVFEAGFQPPAAGSYQAYLRIRGAGGRVALSDARFFVWADSVEKAPGALVFVGEHYGTLTKQTLRPLLEEVLKERVMETLWMDEAPGEGAFYRTLLPYYRDEGKHGEKLVIWMGLTMDADAQAAFGEFLQAGGRLLLMSYELGGSLDVERFLQEMLHARAVQVQTRTASLRMLYQGEPLTFSAKYAALEPMEPAVPFLVDNAKNRIAGLQLDTGVYRLVYLPFDWPPALRKGQGKLLLESVVAFLQQQTAVGVELEIPDHRQIGHGVVVPSAQEVPVRASLDGPVAGVDLIVRSFPELTPVAELPMQRVEERATGPVFEAAFEPPDQGQYQLFVQLSTLDGKIVFNPAGLRLLSLSTEKPVLVLLGENYTGAEKNRLRASLGETLGGLEREANYVDLSNTDRALVKILLGSYLGQGRLVMWLGEIMEEGLQTSLRTFLEDGGRLFLGSLWLNASPGSSAFLEEMIHVSRLVSWGASTVRGTRLLPGSGLEFPIRHAALRRLFAPAEPVLLNEKDQVAGLQVDTGTYRMVYLPFDLGQVDTEPLQQVLEATLPFLLRRQARLEIARILEPGLATRMQPLRPQLVVSNTGEEVSQAFRVGYQILAGEQLLTQSEQREAPLAPGQERAIRLPVFQADREGRLRIRFGVGAAGDEPFEFGPGQPLYVVEEVAPFGAIELEGAVDQGYGVGVFDVDTDGDLDLYLVRTGAADRLFVNEGANFVEQAQAAGLSDAGRGRGLAVGDYDGDGDLDVYLVREEANRFFRHEGAGRFVEQTATLGAALEGEFSLADRGAGRSAGFFDVDRDGDLDLYLVNAAGVNRLYRNEEGMFVEGAAAVGLADAGDGRGLALGDYDGDGDTDVFVANGAGASRLYRNEAGGFQAVNGPLGLERLEGALGAVFGDYDNDGGVDLFVANEGGPNQLFRNAGGASFREVSQDDGFYVGARSRGAAFVDYDSDGDLDLLTTAVHAGAGGDGLHHNGGTYLAPVGALLGLDAERSGQGVGFGDLDGDGDVDLFVGGLEGSRLYRNNAEKGHWLQVDLQGVEWNRHGLGARVEVVARGKRQYRQVQSAYGHGSQKGPRVHFGLGEAVVDTVRVRWPDGEETVQVQLDADQLLRLQHPALPTAVVNAPQVAPSFFQLGPNYPNPFNAGTLLSYQLPQRARVQLTVYNVAGQPVKRLVREEQEAGSYRIAWDGRDGAGRAVGSGVYLVRLVAGDRAQTRRLLLLK